MADPTHNRTDAEHRILRVALEMPYGTLTVDRALSEAHSSGRPVTLEDCADYLEWLLKVFKQVDVEKQEATRELAVVLTDIEGLGRVMRRAGVSMARTSP